MVLIARTMKRPKRRATTDLHDFHEFPSSFSYVGPFRSNVVDLLERFARPPPPLSDLLPLPPYLRPWRVSFRVTGDEESGGEAAVVDLDVVEEDVAVARSVYCDHCRVVGWSGHPVCRKRYHFIIRSGGSSAARVHQMCIRCGTSFESSDIRCQPSLSLSWPSTMDAMERFSIAATSPLCCPIVCSWTSIFFGAPRL